MPIITKRPQAQTEQPPEEAISTQTDVKPEIQTEQNGPQPIPETTESATEQIPPHLQENEPQTIITNTTSNKEKPIMNENTITRTVSAPTQIFTPNNEPANPLDELTSKSRA